MVQADVETALRLERECFSTPWSRQSFQLSLLDSSSFALAAHRGRQMVGYLIAFRQGRVFLIANIAVSPCCRRQGLGSRLLKASFDQALSWGASYALLDVRESNQAAISLYLKLGFQRLGTRPGYYRRPLEDALTMGKVIQPAGL